MSDQGALFDVPHSTIEVPAATPAAKRPTWADHNGKRTACEICAQLDIDSRRRGEDGVPPWPARFVRRADGVSVKVCREHGDVMREADKREAERMPGTAPARRRRRHAA